MAETALDVARRAVGDDGGQRDDAAWSDDDVVGTLELRRADLVDDAPRWIWQAAERLGRQTQRPARRACSSSGCIACILRRYQQRR